MLDVKRQWLRDFPWSAVCAVHENLCAEAKLAPKTHEHCPEVEQEWAARHAQPMSLYEALDLCRRAQVQQPFVYQNHATFNRLANALLDGMTRSLPPVETQILRNTVNHYVGGHISARELKSVFRCFRKLLAPPPAEPAPACATAPQTVAAK